MANDKRLVLSISEEEKEKLDRLASELGMNRSQYVRYLLSGAKRVMVTPLKYQKLLEHISEIDLSLRVIAFKDEISDVDKLAIARELDSLKKILCEVTTCGQVDHKLGKVDIDG